MFYVEQSGPQDALACSREQMPEIGLERFAFKIRTANGETRSELGQNLSARSTRSDGLLGVGNNRDGFELPLARSDGGKNRVALRATREAKREVLDVASREDAPAFPAQSGPDRKTRIRRVGSISRFPGVDEE